MLSKSLSFLLAAQIVLCALSLGFTPAILAAFALMAAAPVSFLRSMAAHGIAFLLVPCITGIVAFQALVLSPVFLVWIVLIVVASLICWNRGPGKPQFFSAGSQ